MKRIGIVTTQFPSLTRAGGIANVTYRFALELVAYGYDVEVLVLRTENPLTRSIVDFYANQSIKIFQIPVNVEETSPWWLGAQLAVERAVTDNNYDVVISQEWQGLLSLSAQLTSDHPPVITWLHGGVIYDRYGSERDYSHKFEFIDGVLEEVQVAKSSIVISASQFLVDFYKDFGWRIGVPKVLPYLIPENLICEATHKSDRDIVLAFVGALSFRKGFDQFLNYVVELSKSEVNFSIKIYGNFLDLDRESIFTKLESSGKKYSINEALTPEEIWGELSEFNATLIVPSRIDNSPGVIYEALASNVKILVSDTNGGAELISSFPEVMSLISSDFVNEHKDFIQGLTKSTLNVSDFNQKVMRSWISILESVMAQNDELKSVLNQVIDNEEQISVSVVIATKNRPEFLKAAVDSVINQTRKPLEIIVVEDNTDGPTDVRKFCESQSLGFPIRYFDVGVELGENRYPSSTKLRINKFAASARNLGASRAKGSLLAFLDDDNLFYPFHLEASVSRLIKENADAVTGFLGQTPSSQVLSLQKSFGQIAVMAGSHFGALNLLTNVAMDSEIVVRKEVFDAVGGFPLDAAPEDWGLALNLIAQNFKIATTGRVSILYRLNHTGIMGTMASSNTRWWELDRNSAGFGLSKENSWWLSHLARNFLFLGQDFGSGPLKQNYLQYGIYLLKNGKIRLLLHGVKKYLIRRKYL